MDTSSQNYFENNSDPFLLFCLDSLDKWFQMSKDAFEMYLGLSIVVVPHCKPQITARLRKAQFKDLRGHWACKPQPVSSSHSAALMSRGLCWLFSILVLKGSIHKSHHVTSTPVMRSSLLKLWACECLHMGEAHTALFSLCLNLCTQAIQLPTKESAVGYSCLMYLQLYEQNIKNKLDASR